MKTLTKALQERSQNKCELCGSHDTLSVFDVPVSPDDAETSIAICSTCEQQILSADYDLNHWRCLNDSMWSSVPAVQVMSWRLLNKLDSEAWAQDALDMLYLEDNIRTWAEAETLADDEKVVHKDINGTVLIAGDSVVIAKDLDVKGAGFTAKRGTAVRGISLSPNPDHIEGRVNGTRIVLLTKFVKKM